jgi:tetratricopeptide (TPR) repeat protein
MAERLRQAYLENGDAATLGRALEASEVAVESAPADDFTARGLALGLRCVLLRMAYQRDKDPAKLSQAIEAGRTAKALFKPADPGFPKTLNSLGNALQEEYGRTRHPSILSEALMLYREAVRVLPEGHPEIPGMYSNIGNVLMTQGLQDRNPRLLVEAVQAGREAVGMTDPEGPAFATRLANLGMALVAHYANCDGPPAELDEAERLFNEALATLPPAHALRPHVQNYLNGVSTLRLSQ